MSGGGPCCCQCGPQRSWNAVAMTLIRLMFYPVYPLALRLRDAYRRFFGSLQYPSNEMQGQYGFMLGHAGDALRADKQVVLATVRQTGIALQCAAKETS